MAMSDASSAADKKFSCNMKLLTLKSQLLVPELLPACTERSRSKRQSKGSRRTTFNFKLLTVNCILFLCCLLFGSAAWGQANVTVTIGDGTSYSNKCPICTYYNYSITEQLYTASEIGMAGTIQKISFYYSGTAAKDYPIEVFMKEVDAADLLSGISLSDATSVFNGTLSTTTTEGWVTITLGSPFDYSGTKNLLIGINKGYVYYFSGSTWQYSTTSSTMARYAENDGSAYTTSTTPGSTTNRPNIKLEITPLPCVTLTSPANGAEINTDSPTLQWDAATGATSYHIYLSNTTTKPAQYSYSTSSTSVTASNIPYGVTYCWLVPCDGNGELNSCDDYTYFRRTCPANIAAPTITANADLNNLTCGQTVTLTASGDYSDYRWYSDAACTTQVGSGQTYSFPAGNSSITIYCKSACVSAPAAEVVQPFVYTGSEQTWNVPAGVSEVKLEVWGAQGGYRSSSTYGGKGGYSVGTYSSTPGQTLYVVVGGSGNTGGTSGGYNGGGSRGTYNGGGGATHIATATGVLSGLSGNTEAVLIVAGGGGSDGGSSYSGGAGGGTNGIAPSGGYGTAGGVGTQSAGGTGGNGNSGSFGQGGAGAYASSGYAGAGGGGWYGGGGSYPDGSVDDDLGGAGGSGYIGGVSDAQTIAGNAEMPNPAGGTMTGREGNGYARISYSTPEESSLSSAASITASAAPAPATPTVSVASACPGEDVVLTVTNAVNGLTYGWWDNSSCTGDPLYEGTTYTISNMQNDATYYVRAYNGSLDPVHNFDYTGAEQTLIVPSNVSSVTLEVWGAQGGGQQVDGNSNLGVGGLGGYSIGTMSVFGGTTLYISVGGQGGTSSSSAAVGGWNGGGTSYASSSDDPAGGGGGATHIATSTGLLNDLSANQSAVMIVAGGGGGGGEDSEQGGYGGGTIGGTGLYSSSTGGTQSGSGTGGVFGMGASTQYDGGAGGGGWYGGGTDGGSQTIPTSNSSSDANGGCGGSGYVNTSLTSAQTIAGNTSFPAPEGGNETGHTGNGYARITFNVAAPTCMSEIGTVAVDLGTPPSFILNPSSATSCNQTPVTFTITNADNDIEYYVWSDDATHTLETTRIVTPGATTTYTVTAYNAYCSASQSSTVSVDAPEVTIVGSDNGDCVDAGTDVTLSFGDYCPSSLNMENGTIILGSGCSFNYYDHNGSSSSYSNNEDYTQTFTSVNGGPITIEFSNVGAESCCDYIYLYDGEDDTGASLFGNTLYNMTTGVTYTANSGSLTIRFTSDVSNVGSGWVATISTAALNFAWSSGATDPTITVTPSESTTYTVTVTGDGYSCPAIIDYTVRVNPEVEVTPMNPMVCAGRTITLTATGADNYHWNNDALTADITVGAGAYTVTGTNSDGCYAEASTTVTSLTTPSAGTIADMEVCQSDALITLASTTPAVGGGNVEYSWTINNNITTDWSSSAETYTLTDANRTALGTGTFNVVRNFRDGCDNSGSATATLTINPHMDAPTISGLTNIYRGLSTTLTAVPAYNSENFHYRWYSDPAGQDLVYEGKDFTTPSLETETTYYLQITDEHIQEGSPLIYNTSGSYTYDVPSNAEYVKLEVWGAQGGGQPFVSNTNAGVGGLGGYSVGNMSVLGNETLYVYVGGHGGSSGDGTGIGEGGYNGGGCTYTSESSDPANGGGGATDIRLNGTTYYDRIIVAGGGGGGGEDDEQGSCGGGGSGSGTYPGTPISAGTGGIFGHGAHSAYDGGGAGGGWYGGGAVGGSQTIPTSNTNGDNNGGSGGSGYVWTAATASNAPSGYNVPSSYYLTDAQTIAGDTEFPAPNGGTETGHQGDGYARITPYYYIQDNCPSELIPVTIEITEPPAPIVQVNSACIGTPSELEIANPIDGFTYQWSTVSDFSTIEATGVIFTPTVDAQTNYYVRSVVGNGEEVLDFYYTGSEQPWTVPAGVTKVKLEVWGAQGGENSSSNMGGKGGYSEGKMAVSAGDVLNVYVGGQGTCMNTTNGTIIAGGFNGGGQCTACSSYLMSSGGGGTDIRVNSTSLYARVIVAGGGGGAGNTSSSGTTTYYGGYAGGTSGTDGTQYGSYGPGGGGTQTTGGASPSGGSGNSNMTFYQGDFGVGGYSTSTSASGGWVGCGGGGGWYGGGSGGAAASGGGGGSGYVYTSSTASNYPSGCLLNSSYYLAEAQTIAGNETFLAPDGTDETGHTGNGYARITLLDFATDYCASPTTTVTINPVAAPTFTLTSSAYSNCNGDPVELTAQNPSSDIISYHWSDGATTTEPSHTVTPGHTTSYAVTATNGTCEIASMPITITVDAPSLLITGSDNGECIVSGTEVTLNAIADMPFPTMASQYQFSVGNRTFEPLTSSSTSISTGDDSYTTVNLDFTFKYCGLDYTKVMVSTNGYIRFIDPNVSGSDTYSNNLTSTTTNPIIAAYWDDLNGNTMYTQTIGTEPNRVFVFHTVGNRLGNADYTYQIRLYETTNIIEVHYGSTFNMSSTDANIGLNSNNEGLSFLSVTPTGNDEATVSTSTATYLNTTQAGYLTAGTLYTFSPFPQFNYQWASNGTTIQGAETNNLTVSPLESVIYTATVTDGEHGCPAIWDYTVKVTPTPSLTTDESPICLGAEATLTAGGAGANGTYNWGEGYVSENENIVSPTNNTTYRVTVKNVNGCTASSYVDQEVQMAPGNTPMTHVVQGHIWTGRVSSDWDDSRNWLVFTGGGSGYTIAANAPTSSDPVVVRTGATCINNEPSVNANSTANNVIIRDGRTLTVEGSRTLAVNGDIDIESGGALAFSGSGTLSVTGDANIASGASVTFGNKDTLNVAGDFTLNGSFSFPVGDTTPALRLGGNLTINNGSSLGTYGTLVFAGNGPQVVENNTTDTLRVRNNVRMNMHHSRAGVPHTEFPDGTIFSKATIFEYGIMDGDVIFDGTGRAIVCGGYESYASGRIEKRGSGNKFTFPTGDDNVLGSVTATISSGKKAYAKFHHWSGDNGDGSHGFGLDVIPRWWNVADMCGEDPFNHVSNFEYWDVSSREELSDVMLMTNAATSAEHFGDESAFVDADIQVAAYKNGCWSNYGGTATISDPDHNVIIIEGARIPIDPHRAAADFLITLGSKSNATVLPIELASVTATCDGHSTLIEWSTATERNNDYFSLERSDDAINFVEIARVAGAGNSIDPVDYAYTDYGIHGGDNYYRLVQVDYDGTRTESEIIVVNCIELEVAEPDVQAYPNPFNDELTVVLDNFGNRAATIEVYDMLGKLIYTNKIAAPQNSYETILNLSNLPPAAYTVRVSTNDFVINKNVVKN